MKTIILCALIFVFAAAAVAETVTPIEVAQVSLPTTHDEAVRPYLLVTLPAVQAPAGYVLGTAFLEFLLDADNVADESASVTLEVYPFPEEAEGALDVSELGRTTMKRSVRVGESRSVRIYVTEFIDQTIKNPNGSRTLLVGSMRGERAGSFSARAVPGASGEKAKLTVYFDRIEDTIAGQSAENGAE